MRMKILMKMNHYRPSSWNNCLAHGCSLVLDNDHDDCKSIQMSYRTIGNGDDDDDLSNRIDSDNCYDDGDDARDDVHYQQHFHCVDADAGVHDEYGHAYAGQHEHDLDANADDDCCNHVEQMQQQVRQNNDHHYSLDEMVVDKDGDNYYHYFHCYSHDWNDDNHNSSDCHCHYCDECPMKYHHLYHNQND